jgi:hypothetical protein
MDPLYEVLAIIFGEFFVHAGDQFYRDDLCHLPRGFFKEKKKLS